MIAFRSVHKRYNETVAVGNLSFEIASGEMCMLVGPSGCGKTTTLKMINRLIEPTSGVIEIDGENILTVDPVELRRHIGYVMQQGGLFPHLRIGENVATVPRLLGWKKPAVDARVEELLTLVGLDPSRYAGRYPHELSGGERQRVGVARALGGDPPVLLMDEPFGAVDPIARRRLQEEFLALQAGLEKTVVFVTHDIDEALHLGSKVAIMREGGELVQYDAPEMLVHHPANSFVAQFIGVRGGLDELGRVLLTSIDVETVPTVSSAMAIAGAELDSPAPFGVAAVIESGQLTGFMAVRTADDGTTTLDGEIVPIGSTVEVGDPLDEVLTSILGFDEPFVGVTEAGCFVGVTTLARLHTAIRRTSAS